MEGENATEPMDTAAPYTGEGIFATAPPPPSDSVSATAASSVSPSSKSQPEQSSMSVCCFILISLSSYVSPCSLSIGSTPLEALS